MKVQSPLKDKRILVVDDEEDVLLTIRDLLDESIVDVASDYEGAFGRKTYASNTVGGYYAARLAVLERLFKLKRKAAVLAIREVGKGYAIPLGVWQVRENVRNAMKQKPFKYNTLKAALTRIASQFQIPLERWIERSSLLKDALFQRRISDYLRV